MLLKNAKRRKYSSCVSGSYLWSWHWAQAMVVPIQTAMVVLTRSTTATLRNSSSLVPPSLLVSVLRWKAVATSCSSVGSGSRSPAICSIVNWSNGLFGVERPDDVVAVGPDGARRVVGVAGRVGVAGQVEPHPRPVLAVGGLRQQAIDEFLVGVGARVADEPLDLLQGRRQAGQVEREPADQGVRGRPRARASAPRARGGPG